VEAIGYKEASSHQFEMICKKCIFTIDSFFSYLSKGGKEERQEGKPDNDDSLLRKN